MRVFRSISSARVDGGLVMMALRTANFVPGVLCSYHPRRFHPVEHGTFVHQSFAIGWLCSPADAIH